MKKILLSLLVTLSLSAQVEVGDKAVAFTLKTLDATKSYKMQDFKGEVVLLNLWASWCSGCKNEMPEFFEFQKKHKNLVKIVTVSIDSERENSEDFLSSVSKDVGYATPFITLYDPNKKLAKAYKAFAMPSSYLIDKKGILREIVVGSIDHDGLEKLLQTIKKLNRE